MALRVFQQNKPKNLGIPLPGQNPNMLTWHEATLVEVGVVGTWDEAKKLTPAPIVEVIVEKKQ